ncbi:alpha/beta hydrolase [Streptomyces decoyicus]|uniref:Alpha/beta hydrolase n=1 Tax=Streptomyces decoyicus TaxID=249567 RepID=A0ABZ1FRX8_9ACTN|nr:alpha/beta hydrolase [Streptomyces decoyicus]WSB73215.1 alpha/beta hydrolase [Streptomyces decoyicus]
MATFVLVPGAWLGAWAWEATAHALRERGHAALPMTLTGLGERSALATPEVGLDTHIDDITAFVVEQDLREVTLVAHSYAAVPVTGAAARLGPRLERLVYLDSAPFAEDTCLLDVMPDDVVDQLHRQVAEHGDGWRLPLPPFELLGRFSTLEGLDEVQLGLMRTRSTPQPFSTFQQRLTHVGELGSDVDHVVVACHDAKALLDAGVPTLDFLNQSPWRRFHLPTGHWPMLSTPVQLAETFDAVVSSTC